MPETPPSPPRPCLRAAGRSPWPAGRQCVAVRQRASRLALRALALCLLCLSAALRPVSAQSALTPATLMTVWDPQAQFAGYYVALEQGFYARRGIDLHIRPGGAGASSLQALESGEVDFAVLWLTTALQRRAEGVALVNLAQIIQRSSMMLVARRDAGIERIEDMQGRSVSLWRGDLSILPRLLFERRGVQVRELPQGYTVNLFLRGGVDVVSAMWFNEYHSILSAGVDPDELQSFYLGEEGPNFPEDGLYALASTVTRDPALTEAFVAASLEGWRHAFEHPEQALDVVIARMREAHLPANRVHQRWMLEHMRTLMEPLHEGGQWGRLSRADFQAVAAALREAGQLEAAPAFENFLWSPHAGSP